MEVERLAAEFFGTAGAFYFASGYAGNHILIQALADRADVVLADESAHFCLAEASRLLGRPVESFRHRDPDDLRQKLCSTPARPKATGADRRRLFLTGAVAPIDQYVEALRDYGTATLLVDDAHGIGTIGRNGRRFAGASGAVERECQRRSGPERSGALRLRHTEQGDRRLRRRFCPAVWPCWIACGKRRIITKGPAPRCRPRRGPRPRRWKSCSASRSFASAWIKTCGGSAAACAALGLAVDDWPTPIIGLSIGNGENMRRIHDKLRQAGIIVPYFAAYSGAGPAGRLRIAVFATHTEEMLDRLLAELRKVL